MVCSVKSPSSQSLKFITELIPTEKEFDLLFEIFDLEIRASLERMGRTDIAINLTFFQLTMFPT